MTQKNINHNLASNLDIEHIPVPEPKLAKSSEKLTCLTIKTGNPDCIAHFYPALYQLTLVRNDNEEKVELGFSGSRLLERLARNPGEVVNREDLMSHAWSDRVVGQGSLNQQIYTLRQILGDEKEREIIQTLPRRGYQLNPRCVEIEVVLPPPILIQQEIETPALVEASEMPINQLHASNRTDTKKPEVASVRRWWIPTAITALLMAASSLMLLSNSHSAAVTKSSKTGQASSTQALKLIYSSQIPEELAALKRAESNLVSQIQTLAHKPTQVIIGLHDNMLDITCLSADGRASTLHVPQAQMLEIGASELNSCSL